MKSIIKTHAISHVKRCSVIAFASMLTLTSVISFAQPNTTEQANTSAMTKAKSQVSVVYLNNSLIEQLETLKGIGHKKAQAIITYREEVGAFKSVTELTQIKGIGEKILSDNKARLQI